MVYNYYFIFVQSREAIAIASRIELRVSPSAASIASCSFRRKTTKKVTLRGKKISPIIQYKFNTIKVVTFSVNLRLNDKMEQIENSLIRQILNGATERYAELVQFHENAVFALIVRIVGHSEEAEELTQDVFLKAYSNLHKFKRQSSFSTWLYRIAYNEAISHTRGRKAVQLQLDESRLMKINDNELELFEQSDGSEDDIERLIRAIEALPSEERALITMVYYNNFSLQKCAEITDQSLGNVKVRLHRIRRKLYQMIKNENNG